MAGSSFDSLTAEQKLRMTIHRDVQAICQEATHFIGMELQSHAAELIAELVWKKLKVYATDLEQFAAHAKRSTIKPEDVKLLVRRNPCLKDHLTKTAETNVPSAPKDTKKKRTTISTPVGSNIAQPSTSSSSNSIFPPKGIEAIPSFMKNLTTKEYAIDSVYDTDPNDDTIDLT